MRSKAHLLNHPIHPMLISFPIAAVVGALVCDIISMAAASYNWFFCGYILTIAAIGFGLIAAVPGLVDYLFVIPTGTFAKRYATWHMLLNVTIVGLYVVSWLVKNFAGRPTGWSILLEVVGTAMLLVSGWLGWTLVYEEHIGLSISDEMIEWETAVERKKTDTTGRVA